MDVEKNWKDSVHDLHQQSYLWSLNCCYFDEEMAKDVLQTVYLKIYEGRALYNRKATLKSWLFSVIKYTSVDLMRKHKRRADKLRETHKQIVETEEGIREDNQGLFMKLLRSLSSQQCQVLTLAFYHDLTLEEIAGLLKLSIGSVRTHYGRGKENLKRLLVQYKIDKE